jgi:macrolide-specific efflux system membrane fusion protein
VAAAVVIVLAGGGAAWAKTRGSSTPGPTTQLVAAKVATVTQTVSASGTIAAANEADLSFATSGRVTRVLVASGDRVTKGQPLAMVGTASLTASYAAAKAQRDAAESTAASDGSLSSAQRAADAAQVTAAKAGVTDARQALADATLRSTIAGTVTSIDLTRGEAVSGSGTSSSDTTGTTGTTASSGRGTAVGATSSASTSTATTSSGSQVVVQSAGTIVNGSVDDTEVQQVKKGQSVAITPDGATSTVPGVVTSVSSVPSSSAGVVTFPVVVRITGHPKGVYAGATATMTITTTHVPNVLEIPTLAITYSGSNASVQVRQGGSTVKRSVTLGTAYGLESQVLSGIKAGEKVVVTIPTFAGRVGGTGGGGFGQRGGTGTGTGGFGSGGGFTGGGGFGGAGGGGG